MRTTLGFRQEEFIQNGEMKVTLKEQNADHFFTQVMLQDDNTRQTVGEHPKGSYEGNNHH